MPTPQSLPRRRLDELLADLEWHTTEHVIQHVAAHVPPGQAARHAERIRARHPKPGSAAAAGRVIGDETTAVRSGQRALARKMISRAIRDRRLETDGDRIRLTPRH